MTIIGIFIKHGASDEYVGELTSLTIRHESVRIVRIAHRGSDSAPTHRMMLDDLKLAPGWTKTTEDGRDYIGFKFDDPSFVAPIRVSSTVAMVGPSTSAGRGRRGARRLTSAAPPGLAGRGSSCPTVSISAITKSIGISPLQAVFRRVAGIIERQPPDLVAFMGDFTTRGDRAALSDCVAYIRQLFPAGSRGPAMLLFGNHDVNRADDPDSDERFATISSSPVLVPSSPRPRRSSSLRIIRLSLIRPGI